jgi:hypothetical protein
MVVIHESLWESRVWRVGQVLSPTGCVYRFESLQHSPKKKIYLSGMSILSILLSLEPGCHNPPPLEDRRPHRSTPSQERPLLAMSVHPVLAYVYRTSN